MLDKLKPDLSRFKNIMLIKIKGKKNENKTNKATQNKVNILLNSSQVVHIVMVYRLAKFYTSSLALFSLSSLLIYGLLYGRQR